MGHKYEPLPHQGELHPKAWGYELWMVRPAVAEMVRA